jgi:hypothetical protein
VVAFAELLAAPIFSPLVFTVSYKVREPDSGFSKEYQDALEFLNDGTCQVPDMTLDKAKSIFVANTVWQRNKHGDLEADIIDPNQLKAFLALQTRLTAHLTPERARFWAEKCGPLQVEPAKPSKGR